MKEIILSKEFVSLSISISSPSLFVEARLACVAGVIGEGEGERGSRLPRSPSPSPITPATQAKARPDQNNPSNFDWNKIMFLVAYN